MSSTLLTRAPVSRTRTHSALSTTPPLTARSGEGPPLSDPLERIGVGALDDAIAKRLWSDSALAEERSVQAGGE